MPEPSVVTSHVTYRIEEATLVQEIDFAAMPGELVAVLGPNGAGKSTLLGLLAGDIFPTEGHVTLAGVDTIERAHSELSVLRSVLRDHVPVEVPFTVQSVVEMGRFPYRRDPANSPQRDRDAVSKAMLNTATLGLADRVFSTLSSGERARVALARVLAQDTPLVLLDEPTAALDVANRERILSVAVRLARDGRSVVSVLHDLNSAAFYADRLALMAEGSITATGVPGDVLRADLLSDIYDQPMQVVSHPFRDCPLVLVGDNSDPDNTRT